MRHVCEHTHTITEETYMLYVVGVRSPIPFQKAALFLYTTCVMVMATPMPF